MNDESLEELEKINSTLDTIEESSDLNGMYDVFLTYCKFCASVDKDCLTLRKRSGDREFDIFRESWNSRLSGTCGDLNVIMEKVQTSFLNITSITEGLHIHSSIESPFKERFIKQCEAQIALNSKIVVYNRSTFIFVLKNSLTHHEKLLYDFSHYANKETGVGMW